MIQNLINHVSLVVDRSGSMQGKPVVTVFDKELEYLKRRSVELNQETRISIYLFDHKIECIAFDMDVMRFQTLKGHYSVRGQTALIDAVLKSMEDAALLPEIYGDHAFLHYVLTDGEENYSSHSASTLSQKIRSLKDNVTLACLVPDAKGVHEAKKFGFQQESVAIWDTTSHDGFEKAGKQFSSAMDTYMTNRAAGIRSTNSFFTINTAGVKKSALTPVPPVEYEVFPVRSEKPIKEFVESWTRTPYVLGSAYYQPTKKVKIQNYKNVLVQDIKTGKVYEGDNLRSLLGLPDHTAEVDPGMHKDWRVFVQSTSVNRKLYPDTFLLLRK